MFLHLTWKINQNNRNNSENKYCVSIRHYLQHLRDIDEGKNVFVENNCSNINVVTSTVLTVEY